MHREGSGGLPNRPMDKRVAHLVGESLGGKGKRLNRSDSQELLMNQGVGRVHDVNMLDLVKVCRECPAKSLCKAPSRPTQKLEGETLCLTFRLPYWIAWTLLLIGCPASA